MQQVGNHTLIGASGDLSDYQKIIKMVQEMQTYDMAHDDGCSMSPKDFHQYLGRVMYNRRNKFDPYWNEMIVAGFKDGKLLEEFATAKKDRVTELTDAVAS